jgi:hypothetical protein
VCECDAGGRLKGSAMFGAALKHKRWQFKDVGEPALFAVAIAFEGEPEASKRASSRCEAAADRRSRRKDASWYGGACCWCLGVVLV